MRAQLESVLHSGETLTEFVETSVRNAVEFRSAQSRFLERGQSVWVNFQRSTVGAPADDVLAKLQAKLDARRQQLAR